MAKCSQLTPLPFKGLRRERCCLQAGRLMSACFSNDMSTLSIFTEDDGDNSAGVCLLTVSNVTGPVNVIS